MATVEWVFYATAGPGRASLLGSGNISVGRSAAGPARVYCTLGRAWSDFRQDQNQRCMQTGAIGILPSIFASKVINRWNLLHQRTVDALSVNAFKFRLCYIRHNRMGFFMD